MAVIHGVVTAALLARAWVLAAILERLESDLLIPTVDVIVV